MTTPDLYDLVAYPALAYRDTHPGRLAAMAILHGLDPAPVESCRVLEVGCNSGSNLIPMAYAIPGGEFVGFDLAALPVARGQQRIRELGLTNIRLLQADLMETGDKPELEGKFDYIIAHGLYAWVPQAVRDGLLAFCREHLAERGVVFVSYAALPGGQMLLLARQMMLYQGFDAHDPVASVRRSIEFLRFIAGTRPKGDGYRVLLERHVEKMVRRSPEVVFHDELASAYQPVTFSQFAQHAAHHGLRYFSEATLPPPIDPLYDERIATTIQKLSGGDPLVQEQMLDFARMQQYRESLLCHEGQAFTYDIDASSLPRLRMASAARSEPGETAGTRTYLIPGGVQIETQHPATIAVLEYLIERFPEAVEYSELLALVARQEANAESQLPVLMLRLIVSQLAATTAWKAPMTGLVAERPVASRLCRYDAVHNTHIVTLDQNVMEMTDPVARKLIPLLDGSRDRAAILRDLTAALPEMPAQQIADGLETALDQLARSGVLQAAET